MSSDILDLGNSPCLSITSQMTHDKQLPFVFYFNPMAQPWESKSNCQIITGRLKVDMK